MTVFELNGPIFNISPCRLALPELVPIHSFEVPTVGASSNQLRALAGSVRALFGYRLVCAALIATCASIAFGASSGANSAAAGVGLQAGAARLAQQARVMTALIDRRCAAAEDAWRRCHQSLPRLPLKADLLFAPESGADDANYNASADDKRLRDQQWRAWLVKEVPTDASDLFPSVRTIADADLSDPK
jgi:hypothetical protein